MVDRQTIVCDEKNEMIDYAVKEVERSHFQVSHEITNGLIDSVLGNSSRDEMLVHNLRSSQRTVLQEAGITEDVISQANESL